MQSRWVDRDAKAAVDRYAAAGISPELALRVYTTRLLGGDPALVLHGGGNTSVKTPHARSRSATRSRCSASRAPAATWRTIEPAGLPAVRLAPLQQLLARDEVSDDDMVRVQRANLLDPMAPNPSVETAAARLPAAQVRRSHPRQRGGEPDRSGRTAPNLCEEVYGGAHRASCPTCVPGFGLAKAAADDVRARIPRSKGFILDKHGIFTFGESAREAYERMIETGHARAEERLQKNRKAVFKSARNCRSRCRRTTTSRRSSAAPAA